MAWADARDARSWRECPSNVSVDGSTTSSVQLIWFGRPQMKLFRAACTLVFCALSLTGCGEPGRVRVSDQELFGTYVTDFQLVTNTGAGPVVSNAGQEQLTLSSDKTYAQAFSSPTRQFVSHGTWKSNNHFLGGTEVVLVAASLAEDETSGAHGDLFLQVHKEKGRIRLARNEPA